MSERESMPCDVVIIGGGVAGLAAAIRLKQINEDLEVVVLEKGDDAPIVSLNKVAFKAGLRKGMSLALARSSQGCADLEVLHCDKATRREVGEQVAKALETWTPWVEISAEYPGVFLVDPRGMDDFWGSHRAWLEQIRMGVEYALGLRHLRDVPR